MKRKISLSFQENASSFSGASYDADHTSLIFKQRCSEQPMTACKAVTDTYASLQSIVKQDQVLGHDTQMFKSLITGTFDDMIDYVTLLQTAAFKGHTRLCEIIIEKHPSVIIEDLDYSTFSIAARRNFPKVIEVLVQYGSARDIVKSLQIEKDLKKFDRDASQISREASNNTTVIEVVSSTTSNYFSELATRSKIVNTAEINFKDHFKLLKFYKLVYSDEQFKSYLNGTNQTHLQLFLSVEKYICENFFKFVGVCKDISKHYPFSLLNKDCMGNIVSTVKLICYPELDLSLQKEADTSYMGEDSNLS